MIDHQVTVTKGRLTCEISTTGNPVIGRYLLIWLPFSYQRSTNERRSFALMGCLSFFNAFASICLIRSRVTSKT